MGEIDKENPGMKKGRVARRHGERQDVVLRKGTEPHGRWNIDKKCG